MLSDTNSKIWGIMQLHYALNILCNIFTASTFAPVCCNPDLILNLEKIFVTYKQMQNWLGI